MLEAIRHKFPDANSTDDLQWPILKDSTTSSLLPDPPSGAKSNVSSRRPIRGHPTSSRSSASSSFEPDAVPDAVVSYWSALEERHAAAASLSAFKTLSLDISKLPPNWTVIHIILNPDKSTMLLSRLSSSSSPLLFCLPLRGRVDSDEIHLTLGEALAELRNIVRLSDEGARRAVHVRNDDPADRAAWWSERAALDKRLKELLDNIEFCWLGGFKVRLNSRFHAHVRHLNASYGRLYLVLLLILLWAISRISVCAWTKYCRVYCLPRTLKSDSRNQMEHRPPVPHLYFQSPSLTASRHFHRPAGTKSWRTFCASCLTCTSCTAFLSLYPK